MFKMSKFMIFIFVFIISCAKTETLVTYQINENTKKITVTEALKDIKLIFDQIAPQDMNNMFTMSNALKMVVQSRLIEPEIFIIEARGISNYQDDTTYQEMITIQTEILPFQIAFQDGQEKIQRKISKQKLEVAEVSRIMFTNGDPLEAGEEVDGISMQSILEDIIASDDHLNNFAIAAEEYSQEPLGVQNGGYLNYVYRGRFPGLDEVIFKSKFEGVYPEVITDELGSYLLMVHSKVKKVKISELETMGMPMLAYDKEISYINDNIKYLFDRENLELNEIIIINGKEIVVEDMKVSTKLVKIWGKAYTLKELKNIIQVIARRGLDLSNQEIIQMILPQPEQKISQVLQQLAIIYKGYKNNIKYSKEYKELLADNQKSVKLETVYNIISMNLFEGFSTNVSPQESLEFYADTNNREIKSYNDKGEPIYSSFQESKETLEQKIISQRAVLLQEEFRSELVPKYAIVWNEEEFSNFTLLAQENYEDFLASVQ